MASDPAGDELADRIALPGIAVLRATRAHPLLGDAHPIVVADRVVTAMSALDWARPTRIPTVAAPGRLPPGTGALLLNAIAIRAHRAGVAALRYAGPYPTPALYRALARSFRPGADEATFTRDVMTRALRLAHDELAIDFAPAPHERVELVGSGFAELRSGVERVVIAGASFERDGAIARLVPVAGGHACEIWFGDARYATIATLAGERALADGPHPPPALASGVIGKSFPPTLRAAIAELVADAVPAPLAADARARVAARPLSWADLGVHAARASDDDGFAVHAVLWERVAPLGLARLALAIAEALAPVVTSALVAELAPHEPELAPA